MVLRLEVVVVAVIVAIISSTVLYKLNASYVNAIASTKELEFTKTTFIEVNTEKMQGHTYGTYGRRDNGVLTLDNLVYYTENISRLTAQKGTLKGDVLYLYGDVFLEEVDGYEYRTTLATYNQQTEMLYITAPFVGKRDKNIIKGDTLMYDTRIKKASGTKINSVIYTSKKQ